MQKLKSKKQNIKPNSILLSLVLLFSTCGGMRGPNYDIQIFPSESITLTCAGDVDRGIHLAQIKIFISEDASAFFKSQVAANDVDVFIDAPFNSLYPYENSTQTAQIYDSQSLDTRKSIPKNADGNCIARACVNDSSSTFYLRSDSSGFIELWVQLPVCETYTFTITVVAGVNSKDITIAFSKTETASEGEGEE